ncbi:MAG: hypothetical protein N2544_00550 [Burkholderiales bacterium]|nr:hypothetical protein [Burkholderiales bacterium]
MSQGLLARMLREATLFVIVEGVILLSFFVYYAMLAGRFSTEEVGWYALMRRVLALAMPLVTLGLAEGLAKYLATHPGRAARVRLMAISGTLIAAATAGLLAFAAAAPDRAATMLFADVRWARYALPFAAFTMGIAVHMYACGYLRGTLRIGALGVLQVVNLGILPIAVLAIAGDRALHEIVLATGVATALTGVLFLLAGARRAPSSGGQAPDGLSTSAFLRFSVTRVPAALISAGLASLVPVLAQRHIPVEQVGFLSIAVALLIGLAGAIAPLGVVLLPHVSALWASDERERVSGRVHLLIGAAIQIFAFMAAQLILFADLVIGFWVGTAYVEGADVARVVLIAALGYGFYNATRTVLDAVTDRPINAVNAALALAVVAFLALLVPLAPSVIDRAMLYAGCIAVGCSLLGLATYRVLRSLFPGGGREDLRHLVWGLGAAAGTVAIAVLLRPVAARGLAWLLAVEVVLGLVFIGTLWAARFEWVRLVASRLLPLPAGR